MNIRDIVRSVLDREYTYIEGENDEDKDEEIKKKLNEMSSIYSNILQTEGPNFTEPATRFAYLYRYTTCHADMVARAIESTKKIRSLFEGERVQVACIGGGPGSDFLGVLKYMINNNIECDLITTLVDSNPAWAESWLDIDSISRNEIRTSTNNHVIDVTDENSWKIFRGYLSADIFTFIYFISELFYHRDRANEYFRHLFKTAKPGALFMFIDFWNIEVRQWLNTMRKEAGLKSVKTYDWGTFEVDIKEKTDVLDSYIDKFGNAKYRANVFCNVYEKPAKN